MSEWTYVVFPTLQATLPFRPQRVGALLIGETLPLRETIIDCCIQRLRADLPDPLHDAMASSSYRAAMSCVLVKKAPREITYVEHQEM